MPDPDVLFIGDSIGGAAKWGDPFLPPGARHRPLPPAEQWVYPCVSREAGAPYDASIAPEVAQYLEDLRLHPERYGLDANPPD